jgi:hypothetical protein
VLLARRVEVCSFLPHRPKMLMTTESASSFAFPTSIVLPLVITGFLGLFATFLVVYWQQKKSAVPALSVTPEPTTTQKTTVASRKPASNPKQRSLAAEKAHPHQHHHLDLNTLKGHGDSITGIAFTSNGRGLATGKYLCSIS